MLRYVRSGASLAMAHRSFCGVLIILVCFGPLYSAVAAFICIAFKLAEYLHWTGVHISQSLRHIVAYRPPQIPSGTSGRGKTRYGDAPGASDMPASSATLGRGKASANASTAEDSERRHCCPHCNKRFNRPSSLAIHVNTHTGAKRTCRSWRSTETGY